MRVCSLLLLPILVACGAATADAQVHPKARPKPATATPSVSLAGDVYLVMQSGDIKRGAAVEVLLIRDSDHDSLGVLSRRICELVVPLQQEIVDSARVLGDSAKAHPGASSEHLLDPSEQRVRGERLRQELGAGV